MSYPAIFSQIISDSRYNANLDWGKPRRGHPEGTVRGHIGQLERNLSVLESDLDTETLWKLKILIHVHDTFKADASRGVAIMDPNSHASLAKQFLEDFTDDRDLLNMVQFHDEPYALWKQIRRSGTCNQRRLTKLLSTISDWRLFLLFLAIDNVTVGKDAAPVQWSAEELGGRVGLRQDVCEWISRLRQSLQAA